VAQPLSIDAYRLLERKEKEREQGELGKHPVLNAVLPAMSGAMLECLRCLSAERATELVLRMCSHRMGKGTWAADLKDVLDGSSEVLLMDPLSKSPYVYRAGSPLPFLYSVGEDGVDNGGTPGCTVPRGKILRSGDYVFCPADFGKSQGAFQIPADP